MKKNNFILGGDINFREYLNKLPCLVFEDFGYECEGSLQIHHIKSRGAGGLEEGNLIGLCAFHHRRLHDLGRLTFQKQYNTNFKLIAFELYEQFLRENK